MGYKSPQAGRAEEGKTFSSKSISSGHGCIVTTQAKSF